MSFTAHNEELAAEMISRFPRPRSALISLLHLAQHQDGYVTERAMRRIAKLTGTTPAEVKGTASFYEMFQFKPVGRYLVTVCTNISCMLSGARELLEHACDSLGVKVGGTTVDGMLTVGEAECIAACTEAPCLQVNYRYRYRVSLDDFDELVDDLLAGRLAAEIPDHGTLARVRQSIPPERLAGVVPPEQSSTAPGWLSRTGGVLAGGGAGNCDHENSGNGSDPESPAVAGSAATSGTAASVVVKPANASKAGR